MISTHFTASEMIVIDNALTTLQKVLTPKCRNLMPEERELYGVVNEHNKIFIQKINECLTSHPEQKMPQNNWGEFSANFEDRKFLELVLSRLSKISETVKDTKILHGHDLLQAAFRDYNYTQAQYENGVPGFKEKYELLKPFFTQKSSERFSK